MLTRGTPKTANDKSQHQRRRASCLSTAHHSSLQLNTNFTFYLSPLKRWRVEQDALPAPDSSCYVRPP